MRNQIFKLIILLKLIGARIIDDVLFNTTLNSSELTSRGWSGLNLRANETWFSMCGSENILGGFRAPFNQSSNRTNQMISNIFSTPEPHWGVNVRYKVYFIDSWDNERF